MIKGLIKFKNNKMGSLSVEFAGVFFIYCALMYCIYDTYNSIMLQNKLERVTYSVASIFRERSALYELINDTGTGNIDSRFSLCAAGATIVGNVPPCYQTFELINQSQVEQAQKLAKYLLNKDVAVRIDALFVVANSYEELNDATVVPSIPSVTISGEKKGFTATVCPNNSCDSSTPIGQYFANLSNITDDSVATKDYFKLVPQVKRAIGIRGMMNAAATPVNLNKRWIPLYRVNMCVINEESLYLKLFNSTRRESGMLPNLCHEVVVISRCNDLEDPTVGCPIYNTFYVY